MEIPHSLSAWKLTVPPSRVFCLLNPASNEPPRNNNPGTFCTSLHLGMQDGTSGLIPRSNNLVHRGRGKQTSYATLNLSTARWRANLASRLSAKNKKKEKNVLANLFYKKRKKVYKLPTYYYYCNEIITCLVLVITDEFFPSFFSCLPTPILHYRKFLLAILMRKNPFFKCQIFILFNY